MQLIYCGYFYNIREYVTQHLIFIICYKTSVLEEYYLILNKPGWGYVNIIERCTGCNDNNVLKLAVLEGFVLF